MSIKIVDEKLLDWIIETAVTTANDVDAKLTGFSKLIQCTNAQRHDVANKVFTTVINTLLDNTISVKTVDEYVRSKTNRYNYLGDSESDEWFDDPDEEYLYDKY